MKVELNQKELEAAIIKQAVGELLGNDDQIYIRVHDEVTKRVNAALSKRLDASIERAINETMEKALDSDIQPVNVWGEKTGKPTSIRAALHERARGFWQEKVDNKGEKSSYGGRPRYEHVLSMITAKEFDSAIKQNIVNIASAIKDAVRADFYAQVDAKLNEFFKVNSLFDQNNKKS